MDIRDKARGALVGMALGEALGAPVEGLTRAQIVERAGHLKGFIHPKKVQPPERAILFQKRIYEDETQTALAVLDVLVRRKRLDAESLKERFAELGQPVAGHAFGCFRRARRNLRVAVRRMLKGLPWRETGVGTASCSAAARGVPIGVWFRDDPEARTRAAIDATLLTHRDPRACAATAAIAEVVTLALLAEPETFDATAAACAAGEAARRAEDMLLEEYADLLGSDTAHVHELSEALSVLPEILDEQLEDAFARIVEGAADTGTRPITAATGSFALTGIPSALYLFLSTDDGYEGTVLDAISEGGSSDTIGCLVGGLSGALHGIHGLPRALYDELRNASGVDERGAALVDRTAPPLPPLVVEEGRMTRPSEPVPTRAARQAARRSQHASRGSQRTRGGPPSRRGERPGGRSGGGGRPFGSPPRRGGHRPDRGRGRPGGPGRHAPGGSRSPRVEG